MKLADKLQQLRKQNGYSQEMLADKIGIARQTISKCTTGAQSGRMDKPSQSCMD